MIRESIFEFHLSQEKLKKKSSMKPDKTQSGIDALRILANAISNESDIHVRSNGDIREKRFDEKILNYLGTWFQVRSATRFRDS